MVPFGFSIGDFIAMTQLVREVWACASAAPGLKKEIECLVNHYHELLLLMPLAISAYHRNEGTISDATKNCLELHLARCHGHLDAFRREVKAVIASSVDKGTAIKVKDFGRRLRFATTRSALFDQLNQSFRRDLDAFRLCTEAIASEQMANVSRTVSESHSLQQDQQQSFGALICMLGSMPKDLGYTWEGGELKRHLTLVQASGEVQTIPHELCVNFEAFHRLLLVQGGYPGRMRVERDHYRVIDSSSGNVLDATNPTGWDTFIRPGATVNVSVAIGTWLKCKSTNNYCPKCFGESIRDGTFAATKQCRDCGIVWDQLAIENWQHAREPIDAPFQWDHPSIEQRPTDKGDSPLGTALKDMNIGSDAAAQETRPPNTHDSGSATSSAQVLTSDAPVYRDREDRLQRVTVVFAPMFNYVFRAITCGCRIAGDASPFARDIDIPLETVCRLHFFDEAQEKLGLNLTQPAEGYDPEMDRYFNQFGGHLAFAAFIAVHPIVQRAIDVRKMLPSYKIAEAADALRIASGVTEQGQALMDWQTMYNDWYMKWRSEHGREHEERMKQLRQLESPTSVKRRDSF
ncbi:hypothetical protein LTR85_011093 [Meristemomyces frigidus]|nr:hypothetical protein LTR85_011093 [Meristemomyces frigidus]